MRSAFSFTFAHYHSFRCIRSKFSYKVLDIVTHSLCKSLSIVFFFDIHPTALSERSVRIFLLFSSVRPSYIFRVRHPITPYNGVIVELYQI